MDYDRYGAAIRAEYDSFLGNLTADYLALTSAGRGLDGVGQFRLGGLAMISTMLGRVIALTNDYVVPLGGGAIRDARDNPWLNSLRQIATKNLNDLIVKLMGGGPRPADLLTRPAGAIGLLLQRKLERPRLTARDSSGRAWPADKLVAVMARDFAYQVYLDATIDKFDEEGVEWVQVVYPDSTHDNHGLPMRLDEVSLVRKTIFHPNSHARLMPYVPSES